MRNQMEFVIVSTQRTYPFWWWDDIIPILGIDDLWNDLGSWVDEIVMFKN